MAIQGQEVVVPGEILEGLKLMQASRTGKLHINFGLSHFSKSCNNRKCVKLCCDR